MENKLKRDLGLLDIFCLSSGAMISSGIFILPGLAYQQAGPLVFVSYFLAGLLALLGTLSVIELSTAMPKAGGDYFFITRTLGPLIGTISSFLSWTALCLKSSFAVFGIAEILYLTFGFPVLTSSIILCCFFVGLNLFGAKESAKFEVILVLCLLGIMIFLAVGGHAKISAHNFKPLMPYGFNRVLRTSAFVFISFGGLLTIATVSEEVKNPKKNIPLGMILSVLLVTVLYSVVIVTVVGVVPGSNLSTSLSPVADTGRILFGKAGYIIVSIAALLAFFTTANAGILSASRYPLALSQDNLIPKFISYLTKSKKVPALAIIFTGLFIMICLFLKLTTLVKLGSIVILTLYVLTNIAVFILREGRIQNYKPSFRMPFYPWLNVLSVVFFSLLIIDMGFVAVEISLSIVVIAALLYFFYGRKRHKIEYALLHLLERVIDKNLTSNILEDELRQIVIERDELTNDRFHSLVEQATIMDVKGNITLDDFLGLLPLEAIDEVGLNREEIFGLFRQREAAGSTAITAFVAIPHIIIPGENKFKLIVCRALNGINFSKENDSVNAVFALLGTKDERAFHLKVLSIIAHIVQSSDFEKHWLRAKNKGQIRDILLLSERKR